ncbi:MAG: peptidase [Gammaproteobacteria bacterium]|nr:peptidase [Gammaproteobacteria bacterium]MAY01949.1 peptidase [Gammaproteobacteria bacterium]|tara:strand:+ start:60038 stop:61297 length:1260 start_codon:yes stop_codon:yes gene_type:complete
MFKNISVLLGTLILVGCSLSRQDQSISAEDVVDTYISIAQAAYEDSLISARVMEDAIAALLDNPNEMTLAYARNAWLAARVPYQQTEVYRFGNAVVDEWEVRVNAWPLDEGLIDYTAASYGEESDINYFYNANIIANELIDVGGVSVDAAQISPQLLAETLHEIDGVESNVATGYHVIEFLLWGQDLNGTNPGAGERPATDFSLQNCSNGNCDRRRDYLEAATSLLIADLEEMVFNWQPGGAAYQDLRSKGPDGGLATMLTGMGSLAYGELAGERIRLGLLLNDPEEEHDCFSDNTHNSHYYNALGIKNVYLGEYERINGTVVSGPSLEDLLEQEAPVVAAQMRARLESTELAMNDMVAEARRGNTFDVLIASNNAEGEAIVSNVVDALMEETRTIEDIIRVLNLQNVSIEGSDSLTPL